MESRPNGGDTASTPIPVTRPTSSSLADQWRRYLAAQRRQTAVVVDLVLPSGMTVRAMRPNLLQLLGTGRIPDALAAPVHELIALGAVAGGDAQVATELRRRSDADPVGFGSQFLAILDAVWLAAVVEPRFVADHPGGGPETEADAEALPLGQVDVDDKSYLFVWAQGVDLDVRTFLDRQTRAGAAVRAAPVGDDVPPGPGEPARARYEG
jgi:hypothetical protein